MPVASTPSERRWAVMCPGPQPRSRTAPDRIERCRVTRSRSSTCTSELRPNSSMYCSAMSPYERRTSSTTGNLHLAVTDRAGGLVGAENDSEVGHRELDGAHRRRQVAVVEEAAADLI